MERIIWALAAWAVILLNGCISNGSTRNKKQKAQPFPVTQLETKDTLLKHSYVASLQAVRNVEIRARVNGFLEKIYVDEGQDVKKGQLLFSITNEEYKAQLAEANANLSSAIAEAKAAEVDTRRVKMLVDKKVIAPTELEVANAKLTAAHARIDEARSAVTKATMHVNYTNIHAPFDGIIDRIPLKTGSLVTDGTLLTTVSDTHEMYAYFNVSETEYLEYQKSKKGPSNKTVQLILADGTSYKYPGKVETVEGEFESSTGAIAFRARFPNPQKLLKHGASGNVQLENTVEDALIIPQKAVFEMQDKNYVFVVDNANRVAMRSFMPGSRLAHCYIVKDGLQPGERIVCEGTQSIRDGMHISPVIIPLDSLLDKKM
jgi:membrane fusion protein (multidrug efflux system)